MPASFTVPQGVFFFHNPKAGGTSLSDWLSKSFSSEQRCPLIENDSVGHALLNRDYSAFRGYDFYSGHYGKDVFDAVRVEHVPTTNFRHPVDRIVSLYNFFRLVVPETPQFMEDVRYACVHAAKRQDFRAFIESPDPQVHVYTRDHHVRQLSRSGWEFTADLDGAKALVDDMPWFYVAEEEMLSLQWATAWLGAEVPPLARENATPDHPDRVKSIEADIRELILLTNELDLALFDYATARLRASVSNI